MKALRRRPDRIRPEERQPTVGKINLELPTVSVPLGRFYCVGLGGPATYGEIAMVSFNGSARTCEVDRGEDKLACEVGPAHDYFWHCRHRARRSGQLVDIAMLLTLAAMVSWVLLQHP
jgi:hypothetical protein